MPFNRNTTYACLPLALLLTTGSLASDPVEKPQFSIEKLTNELANITKMSTPFLNEEEFSQTSQIPTIYSAEEYEPILEFLTKPDQYKSLSPKND